MDKTIKKITNIISIILILFCFTSCKNEEVDEEYEYMIKNDVGIYTLKSDVEKLDIDKKIDNITDIEFNQEYTILVLIYDYCKDEMSTEIINTLYSYIRQENNFMIIFLGFPDYNLFANTGFANEKDFYPAESYGRSIANFGLEEGVVTRNSTIVTEEGIRIYSYVTHFVCKNIKEYVGRQ